MTVKGEILEGVRGARVEFGTVTSSDPASINTLAEGTATLTISGVDSTDLVFLNPRGLVAGLIMKKATVTGANTVTVTLFNGTAGSVNDAASDYDYVLIKRAD
jgi:hypothetical protein